MHKKRVLRRLSVGSLLALSMVLGSMFLQAAPVSAKVCCACKKASSPGANICLTGDADTCGELISQSGSPALSDVTCGPVSLSDSQCDRLTQGGSGICTGRPISITGIEELSPKPGTAAPTQDETNAPVVSKTDIYPPKLNVPIPGLVFSSRVILEGGEAVIPFMAQYIAAAYRYLLAIVVLTASIAFIYGGFHYILGTTLSSIERGKEIIRDAIIGMVMVFSAHLILITLNPALVNFKGLKVQAVAQTAYSDLAAEHDRAQQAATVPAQTAGQGVEVPVLIETPGTPDRPSQLVADPLRNPDTSPSGSPVQPQRPPGTVVRDEKGNFVAQGNCPSDMVPIHHSDEYTRGNVASFCMDVYEAPNQLGVKPFSGITSKEADWYCEASGKRLCKDSEWTRACLGPQGKNTYGYGPDFIVNNFWLQSHPGDRSIAKSIQDPPPCNYGATIPPVGPSLANDSVYHQMDFWLTTPDTSIIAPGGSSLLKDPNKKEKVQYVIDKTKEANVSVVLSGSMPSCVTEEGVFDLNGNTQEIMLDDASADLSADQRGAKEKAALQAAVAAGGTNEQIQARMAAAIKNAQLYTWGNFYFYPVAHIADTNAKPTCDRRWGGHGSTWRGFENGFRCCMPLQENP